MLIGHIDLIDRSIVRGWAADTDRPYGTLEVALFVNGRLIGLARADQPRDDLRDPATLGAGVHGISYRFDPPLSALQDHDVVVRFADGGRLLGQRRVAREPEVAAPPANPGAAGLSPAGAQTDAPKAAALQANAQNAGAAGGETPEKLP